MAHNRDKTEPYHFYEDPEVLQSLRGIRNQTGIPVSVLVRRAIRNVLREHGIDVKAPAVRATGNAR